MSRAATADDELATEAAPARRYLSRLTQSFTLLILLFIITVFGVLLRERFLNLRNFNDIAIDSSQLIILTVGMTFVIITAGIDLSVGSVLIVSAVVAARVILRPDESSPRSPDA